MPKSLTHLTLLMLVHNKYVGMERSRLCVTRKTSHLSGLKRCCHVDAQDSKRSTSSCRASLSLVMFDSSLCTLVSSAFLRGYSIVFVVVVVIAERCRCYLSNFQSCQ